MRIADMHCDTINRLYYASCEGKKISLRENDKSVDLIKMRDGGYMLQFFACFVNMGKVKNPCDDAEGMIKLFHKEMKKNSDLIGIVTGYKDITENISKNRMSALLTVEEGGVLKGSIERLKMLYDKAVRLITLTWNYENELGYPNGSEYGLKSAGFEMIKEMEHMGMIIDVSHLSDAGFYDVAKTIRGPFAASHSNARAIAGHRRNLTDDMIKIIANHSGIIGINYFSDFLCDDGQKISRIKDMAEHIKHIKNVGGTDVIGLGSDFDGIDGTLQIKDASGVEILLEYLNSIGFSYDETDKIAGANVLEFLKHVLK